MRFLPVLLATAAAVTAQSPLTTTFAANNNGSPGGGVYFDLTAAAPLSITSLDVDLADAAGTAGTINFYLAPGVSRAGIQTNMAAFTLAGSGTVTAAGYGLPSTVTLGAPIVLPAGLSGVALQAVGVSHAYTNGTGANQTVSTAELTLDAGEASNAAFVAPLFTPRVVNTSISYVLGGSGTFATNTILGTGCGPNIAASVYENFLSSPAFDLANTTVSATNGGGNRVLFTGGSMNPVGSLGTPTALALTDDSSIAAGSLGLTVGSNGWVAFGAGNSTGFTPDVPTMLSNPSAAYYTWHDLNPAAAGSGQVMYEEAGTLAQITFAGVYNFGGATAADANTFQFQVDTATQSCVISWGTMSVNGNGWLVGFSPAGSSQDPGNTDISVALAAGAIIRPSTDVGPLALGVLGGSRPVLGTNWNLQVSSIPPSTVFGINWFGTVDPGILNLAPALPGCQLRSDLGVIQGPWVASGTYNYSFAIPATPTSLIGFQLFTQSATFGVPAVNPFGAITSGGVRGTLGDL